MFSKINQPRAYAFIFLVVFGMTQQAHALTESCRCVAFRLDDVQDYFLNKVQIEVMDTFQKKDAGLTIGIIGNYFGNDQTIVNFLKEKLKTNNPTLEIANHGWNHEDFTKFNKEEQSQLIKKTNQKLSNTLGINSRGFITPFNTVNNDTLTALGENKIQYISANVTTDQPPYNIKRNTLYHFPGTALTGNLNSDNTSWFGTTHKEAFAQIQSSLINYGFAVVTLHPQEYSVRQGLNYTNEADFGQIHELEMLIDAIRNSGLKIVTIKEIPEHFTVHQKNPEWIMNIFIWYENKKISEDEVLDAINFLTEKGIIKFNL